GLAAPFLDRVGERRALRLDDEIDVASRAAERGRGLAGLDVVDRDRAAEGHVQVRVRVDTAWQHVLPGRVDRPVGLHVERLADQRDALVLDVDVTGVVVRRGDDSAALDQDRHDAPFTVAGAQERSRHQDLAYFPPGVTLTVL